MSGTYEDLYNTLHEMDAYALECVKDFAKLIEGQLTFLEQGEKEAEIYQATGLCNTNWLNGVATESADEIGSERSSQGSVESLKENAKSVNAHQPRRTLRSALKEPSQLANVLGNSIATTNEPYPITIKTERLTRDFIAKEVNNKEQADLLIKKEQINMPPPKPARPLRKRKGFTDQAESVKVKTDKLTSRLRNGSKYEALEESIVRESDVQLQEEKMVVVTVDSDEETPRMRTRTKTKVKQTDVADTTIRTTRTKTRNRAKIEKENQKRLRSSSSELEEERDASKGRKARKVDQVSTVEPEVAPKNAKAINLDQTLTEEAEVTSKGTKARKHDHLSNNEAPVAPKGAKSRKISKNNYENEDNTNVVNVVSNLNVTTVISGKNGPSPNATYNINTASEDLIDAATKEQALKELMTDDEDIISTSLTPGKKLKNVKQIFSPYENSPVKNKVQAYEKLAAQGNNGIPEPATPKKKIGETGTNLRSRLPSTRIPTSADKYTRTHTPSVTSVPKSKSAMKASQAEFRRREREALAKKEALLQAQQDEKRRKREERQLKAQQAREALFKSKQSALETAERVKQEKIKQLHAEKEEKLAKKREQSAQREAAAYKRAIEMKKSHKALPVYLMSKAPFLPTTDCYDSDDEDAPTPVQPNWQMHRKLTAKIIIYGDSEKRNWFSTRPQTVNLQDVFPTIEPAKLKRTSSAVWNKSDMVQIPEVDEDE